MCRNYTEGYTFNTLALQDGVDIKIGSGVRGHFSAGLTPDTYTPTISSQKKADGGQILPSERRGIF